MTDEEEKFLRDNFKAGEYSLIQIMVKSEDMETFINNLQKMNLTLAVIPSAKANFDFLKDSDGTTN